MNSDQIFFKEGLTVQTTTYYFLLKKKKKKTITNFLEFEYVNYNLYRIFSFS